TEDGVIITGGTLNAGAGNISIRGESAVEDGVDIRNASAISTTTGTITITGTSTGAMGEDGVQIMSAGTTITSAAGLVTILGTGSGQDGVDIQDGAVVSSTGMAAAGITLAGMASSTMESGVEIEGAGTQVTSVTGPIQITGMNPGDLGVIVEDGAVISSTGMGATAAPITIMGTGDVGLVLFNAGTQVTSVDGDIILNGAGSPNIGMVIDDSASVSSTGTTSDAATITIIGTSDGFDAVRLFNGAEVSSVAGDIQIDGDATGGGDIGVHLEAGSMITSTGTGIDAADIQITGTGDAEEGVASEGMVSSVDGDVRITGNATNDDAVFVGGGSVQSTGTGDVTLTSNDSAATGDDLIVTGGATVQTATGDVILRSGDNLEVESGATVTAGGQLRIEADFADADGGTGAEVTLEGAISTATQGQILGGADDDIITLDPDSTTGSLQIDGQGGDDSYDVTFGNLGGPVDIDDQAAEGTDDLTLEGSAMPNVFTIGAAQTTLGVQTVTYTANLDTIEVNGDAGADTFDVTPSMTATINLLGGDPTIAPGDTVNFMTPAGQSVAVTPNGADGGTFSTSGGFLDVTFDEIEAVSFTGDSLIVNSGGNDDLFDVTLTGADSGTLALTTDVDNVPGPSAMINIMFSGLERLVANGEGGDDVFRQNNTGGPLGLLNGVEFNGGTGSDTLETLGGTATDVIHTFANASDGSITIDTFGLTYTGLEPILDTITAT
ncbi:MAG: beta strand repeat-containing protein, partial [Planctomycetales bacterium]